MVVLKLAMFCIKDKYMLNRLNKKINRYKSFHGNATQEFSCSLQRIYQSPNLLLGKFVVFWNPDVLSG